MPQVSAGSAHSVIHSIVLSASTAPQMPSLGWVVGWAPATEETQSLAWRGPWRAMGRYASWHRSELQRVLHLGPRFAAQLPLHQLGP